MGMIQVNNESGFSPVDVKGLDNDKMDVGIQSLVSPESIYLAQKAGEKLVTDYTTEQYKQLRWLCKNELFFLTYTVLGYKRLSTGLHGDLSEWVGTTNLANYPGTDLPVRFREILLPRGHFKSTVATIAHSIQIILPDDTNSLPWPFNLGTNCRLLIAHETDSQASKFLFAITQHFLSNPLLMALFPECIPNPRKHKINKNELELPRTERWPEPTIDTMGVGGKSQGRHYNYLKLDDLFGDKARDSQAERETTIQWFDNIQSFFSYVQKDRFDLIGTRWALDDLYAHAHRMYEELLVRYIRPVHEYKRNTTTGEITKSYIFPEEFNDTTVKVLQKNRKVWTAQYLNDPKEGANKFNAEWKQFYTWEDTSHIKYKDHSDGEERIISIWSLDRVILIDPATTGLYGYVVTGMDSKRNKFVLKAIEETFSPEVFMDYLFKDVVKYQPRVVGIEEVLFSTLYQIWCLREQTIRGIRFKIEPLKVKKRDEDKELRVSALVPFLSNFEFYFHETQEALLEQYDFFGSISNYHVLDALAHGVQLWRPPVAQEIIDGMNSDTKENERDEVYGYSQI